MAERSFVEEVKMLRLGAGQEQWLQQVVRAAASNPDLAIEVVRCQRLVKGYSDTHARGLRNYNAVIGVLQRGPIAPATLRELRATVRQLQLP